MVLVPTIVLLLWNTSLSIYSFSNPSLQIYRESIPYRLSISVEDQRSRCQQHAYETEDTDAPSISQVVKESWSGQRHDPADNRPEQGATSDSRSSVLLEGIDVVVLDRVQYHYLADAVEECGSDADGPVNMVLNGPREPSVRQSRAWHNVIPILTRTTTLE